MQPSVEILFEDKDIIVCYKEAGVAVQTARLGQKDYVSMLKNYRAERGESTYIGLVTRLDQPVEGIVVFAKHQKAAAELSKQMQNHNWKKCYYAVVEANAQCSDGSEDILLVDYLLKDGKTNTSSVVKKGTPGAKRAELSYQVLEVKEGLSLVKVDLKTGRHHQIRVQLSNAGMPIVGDAKYGVSRFKTPVALCAFEIAFSHPKTKKKMEFSTKPKGEVFAPFFS